MDKYFTTTSYALVATAFATLALTDNLDAASIALYLIALVVSFYRDRRNAERRRREWLWRILPVAYVPFLVLDVMILNTRVVALIHLTLFASAVKLLQPKRDRDWIFLYIIAFFQMLLTAGLTINATFVASLITFLFFFISTLAAFEIRRARREIAALDEEVITRIKLRPKRYERKPARDAARASSHRSRVRYLVGASFAQIIMVAAFTLPLFFLIPRFGGGVVRGSGDSAAISGFSDKVSLGDVASIKKSQRIVMRVQLNTAPPKYLRWRGVALERYDGRSWSVWSIEKRIQELKQGRIISGESSEKEAASDYVYPLGEQPRARPTLIEQKIFLEPLQTPVIFAAQRAIRFSGPVAALNKDTFTSALSSPFIKGRMAYTVVSDVSQPSEQELKLDSPALAPEQIRQRYLQLPRRIDPRIAQLAREITRNAPSPYDKVRAIESFLRTQFQYSLDLKPTTGDPLAEFLFETREGHCEYFATAMVIMLRTLDIPARIVNGFQMGEYNDVSNLYTVRESDAHSWVEAYFPHSDSWIEFDPTPSAGINDYSGGGLLAWFRKHMDALEVFWLDYIVTLDSSEQASLIGSINRKLVALKDRLLIYYRDAKRWLMNVVSVMFIRHDWSAGDVAKLVAMIAALFAALGAVYIFLLYRKRRLVAPTGYGPWWHRLFVLPRWRSKRLIERDRRESAVLFYAQMLRIASRAGLVKAPDQTPMEFAAASGLDQIHEITALYNRVRFGGGALDDSEVRRVSDLLNELKKAAGRKR
ncbi:MAG TPA: DUF3488 and transglutaminase-like domain-containing protein [Blastocatellia bacterium]|nr:DUF3488 and transglutaminase-like domain-containing protein [Blastocatellia bacterium]